MDDPRDGMRDLNGTIYADAKRLGVAYDPDSGGVEVTLELHDPFQPVGPYSRTVSIQLGIGGVGEDGRTCAGPGLNPDTGYGTGRTGDVRFSGDAAFAADGSLSWTQGYSRVVGFVGSITGTTSVNAARTRFTWTLPGHEAVARRDFTCVTDVTMNPYGPSYDEVAPFWFDGFAPPAVLDQAPPVVSWQAPVAGQTISGVWQEAGIAGRHACRLGASDDVGVTRVEFFLDGAFLNEELYAPWACVVDTRTLADGPHTLRAVAYDAAGRSGAQQITVLVDNDPAAPPLPDPPAPPAPPVPSPLTPIVVVAPPPPAGPAPAAPAAPAAVIAADRRAPLARTWAPSRSLRALVGGGMVVPLVCDEACAVRARLLVAPRLARALGLSRLIGSSRPAQGTPGRRALAWVRLSPAARRALRSRRALRATLTLTLSDAAGNRRVLRRSLVLR